MTMTTVYLDIVRDGYLFYSLLTLITWEVWLDFHNFFQFPCQVLWLLLAAILLPLISIGLKVGFQTPLLVLGYDVHTRYNPERCWTLAFLRITNFLLSPAIPALLTNVMESEKRKIRQLFLTEDVTCKHLMLCRERREFLKVVKHNVLFFKEIELVVEVSLQLTISSIMVLTFIS